MTELAFSRGTTALRLIPDMLSCSKGTSFGFGCCSYVVHVFLSFNEFAFCSQLQTVPDAQITTCKLSTKYIVNVINDNFT